MNILGEIPAMRHRQRRIGRQSRHFRREYPEHRRFSAGVATLGAPTTLGPATGGLGIRENMGLSILSVDAAWQMAIKGLVLLLAVAFDIFNKRRGGR
jgi:hypothetical protein